MESERSMAFVRFALLTFLFGLCLGGPRMSDEEILMKYLFDGYNPSARPVLNSLHSVDVKIMFSLLHIQELVRIFLRN